MKNKQKTTSDYNDFTSNTLHAKTTPRKFSQRYKNISNKNRNKIFATKTELKAEQDTIVKLQKYDFSLFFLGQSQYNNDGVQL